MLTAIFFFGGLTCFFFQSREKKEHFTLVQNTVRVYTNAAPNKIQHIVPLRIKLNHGPGQNNQSSGFYSQTSQASDKYGYT
jgi:hypothetical protein